MKKYARLRQDCSEFDNALYDATPEVSFTDHSRAPGASSPPQRALNSPLVARSSHSGLASALKKLGSLREVTASRRHTDVIGIHDGEPRSRSVSGRWPINAQEDASESGRWANAETVSLSGRWGSVSTNDHWDETTATQQGVNSFRDSLSLSRSGRLMQEGEPWTASKPLPQPIHRQSSLRDAAAQPELLTTANSNDQTLTAAEKQNISMKETQGWLASVKRPLQPRKSHSTWDDPNEFNWRAATAPNGRDTRKPPVTISQSMRYDRLKASDLVEKASFDEEDYYHRNGNGNGNGNQAVMQKAFSMREGGAHSDAIMAMARAYSEKHGVPQAILKCVSCGRALGMIVQGNPGNDTSFCQSCRPNAVGGWTYHTKAPAAESGKPKRKGMMHFCKKILRMGEKPHKSKG